MLFLEQLSDRIVPASVAFDGVGNLVVTGDATADHIIITAHNNNDVSVLINSISYGTFNVATPGARLIVFGGSGNDVVNFQGASLPQFSIEEHGGDGNDTLYGGSLNDVLYGDAGNDNLNGGLGADVLVGGAGIDLLTGNAGDDILIGGEVMHFPISTGPGDPSSYDFLVAVRADWLANHDEHSLLVDQLVAQTVDPANSANVDRLIGGGNANLYVHASNDILFGFSATNGDRERLV